MSKSVRKTGAVGASAALLGGAGSAALLALAASSAGALPVTWTVDTTDDGAPNASDCTTPVANSCSLRDALAAGAPGDTIEFAASLFTGGARTITLDAGQGQLEDNGIDISGPGSALLTVDADNNSRVFHVLATGTGTTISGLTITNGYASGGDGGGGIYADTTANPLVVRDVIVTGSTGFAGGGVFSSGDVEIVDSVISGNHAAYFGGGVTGTYLVTVTNSTIADNDVFLEGGSGGGVAAVGEEASVEVVGSTISGNEAGSPGGAGGGVVVFTARGGFTMANSTVTGNTAAYGGGIAIPYASSAEITMSTITGNTATNSGLYESGGGIITSTGPEATGLASRRALGRLGVRFEVGAAIAPTMVLTGTVVAGNIAGAGGAAEISAVGAGEALVTATSSLIGNSVSPNVSIDGTGVLRLDDPKLGALADNGGPTRTMLPLAGSPLVDAGPATIPVFPGNEYDQRGVGYLRIVGASSDIGAVEVQGAGPAPDPVVPRFTG